MLFHHSVAAARASGVPRRHPHAQSFASSGIQAFGHIFVRRPTPLGAKNHGCSSYHTQHRVRQTERGAASLNLSLLQSQQSDGVPVASSRYSVAAGTAICRWAEDVFGACHHARRPCIERRRTRRQRAIWNFREWRTSALRSCCCKDVQLGGCWRCRAAARHFNCSSPMVSIGQYVSSSKPGVRRCCALRSCDCRFLRSSGCWRFRAAAWYNAPRASPVGLGAS